MSTINAERRPGAIILPLGRQVTRPPARPACTTVGTPDDWFPERNEGRPTKRLLERIQAAKNVCHACPVRDWCAVTYADSRFGIVAGFLTDDPAERGRLAEWARNTNGHPEAAAG